jgi:hypothetical protein
MHALTKHVLTAGLALALVACSNVTLEKDYPRDNRTRGSEPRSFYGDDGPGILGSGNLLGGGGEERQQGPAIGVNSYLWRASLDTISFMPVTSADPFGGVIITDWYSPPETPAERFKVNLYILGRQLRADGLRAAVFRQRRGPDGTWQDVDVNGETATKLENAILARAREMRIAAID